MLPALNPTGTFTKIGLRLGPRLPHVAGALDTSSRWYRNHNSHEHGKIVGARPVTENVKTVVQKVKRTVV